MQFPVGAAERWQQGIRSLQERSPAIDRALALKTMRQAVAREALRAQQNLSNITAAYIEACRIAGLKP